MQRREFNQSVAATLLASSGLASVVHAQGGPVAGTDFYKLDKPAPVDAPAGKIELIEFFWYSCPHCNSFEPTFEAWTKRAPKDVVIRRMPVAFRPDFEPQQRLYFALEAMGLLEKLHAKVFYAVHVEKNRLASADAIFDWVAKQGVDKAKFADQFNSFSAAGKVKRAVQLQEAYRVEGVPSLGVAGRFYTDGSIAKNMERALGVAEFLMDEVRKGR
jgi:thiol:disulfide interchange protein DsbA